MIKVHLKNSERNITGLMTLALLRAHNRSIIPSIIIDRDSINNVTKALKNGLKIPSFMDTASQTSNSTWVEIVSYSILTLGTLGDYISTHIGLTFENLYETNPIAEQLVANGMWLPVNLIIVMLGIAVPFLIFRISKEGYYRCILSFPIAYGIVRLSACTWNISLIILTQAL
jgi:hypothetical protein